MSLLAPGSIRYGKEVSGCNKDPAWYSVRHRTGFPRPGPAHCRVALAGHPSSQALFLTGCAQLVQTPAIFLSAAPGPVGQELVPPLVGKDTALLSGVQAGSEQLHRQASL